MNRSRKTRLEIKYNSVDATKDIVKYVESFSYIDSAVGESDRISLSFDNIEKKWLNEWFPQKGDSLEVIIKNTDWESVGIADSVFNCGKFYVDDFTFEGRPLSCSIEAVSIPLDSDFKTTKKTKTWQCATLMQIGNEIAYNAGLNLFYDGDEAWLNNIEQNDQEDCTFLNNLCAKYGFAMKLFGSQIIIYNEEKYENIYSVVDIDEKRMLKWSANSTLSGTYTGGRLQYTNPDTEQDLIIWVGSSPRILDINEPVENLSEAKLIAVNAVNNANKEAVTMNVTIEGIPTLTSTRCVKVTGLGKFNGKYFVTKIKHNISGNGGYTMDLDLRLVQQRLRFNE